VEAEKKPTRCGNPKSQVKSIKGQSFELRRRCCTRRPQTWQARSGEASTDSSAGAGWIAGRGITGLRKRVTGLNERKSISRRGRQNAPPRSGETGGKGCRLSGRGGRHARGRPVLGSRRRRSAGTSASANASEVAGGQLACMRATPSGCMRATQCGAHANVRTDR
jgi:hypothetical protein